MTMLLLLLKVVIDFILWPRGEQSCLDLLATLLQAWQMFLKEECSLFMVPLPLSGSDPGPG